MEALLHVTPLAHALAAWAGTDMIQQAIGLREANF